MLFSVCSIAGPVRLGESEDQTFYRCEDEMLFRLALGDAGVFRIEVPFTLPVRLGKHANGYGTDRCVQGQAITTAS